MITGIIKNKVDRIWTDIWSGGITNPLTIIEQLTYLMFIRSLDQKELELEARNAPMKIFPQSTNGQDMRWSRFKSYDSQRIYDIISKCIFPAIKNMKNGHLPDFDDYGKMIPVEIAFAGTADSIDSDDTAFARYMSDAMFLIPTPQVLKKIIAGLDDLYGHDIANLVDMQGDLYEYMLSKLETAGQNGQFRTPKHIRDMMVELVEPTPDDIICDPACGTAGFLVSSAEYIRQHYEDNMTSEQWEHFSGAMFTGYDIDRTMLRISAMNLMLHSINNPIIDYKDSVSKQNQDADKFTVCLANPPFSGTIDTENINANLQAVVKTPKTELLFLALFLRILKKGGRCACVVPDGVLYGVSSSHKSIRRELIDHHHLYAVIAMPSGVFRPYSVVSTAILVFKKTCDGGTDDVWFYNMHSDGFALTRKRDAISDNDIPDIIHRFKNLAAEKQRKRTDQSFMVSVDEIRKNNYDLSIKKYQEVEYVPITYPSAAEILKKLDDLENDFAACLSTIKSSIDK